MARLKNQTDRRLNLMQAAETMIAREGLPGLTLNGVASEAKMSASALLYYYSNLKELLDDVQTQAVERFCTRRAVEVLQIADPRARLQMMIMTGLPVDATDQLCRLLLELGPYARSDANYAARHIILFERQVSIYVGILEAGVALGQFKLEQSSEQIARSLVVLEDGLGLHLLNKVSALTLPDAKKIMLDFAIMATQCEFNEPNF